MTLSCPVSADNVFGPAVAAPCRAGFDFTLLFEETVLTILPLSLASECEPRLNRSCFYK